MQQTGGGQYKSFAAGPFAALQAQHKNLPIAQALQPKHRGAGAMGRNQSDEALVKGATIDIR